MSMTCSLCTKIALTMAGKKGFCADHRKEAIQAMKAMGDRKAGSGGGFDNWTIDRR